jgi:hypothetical protein
MSTETSTVAAPTHNAVASKALAPAPSKVPAAPAKKPVRKAAKKISPAKRVAKKPAAKKPVQKAVPQKAPQSAAKSTAKPAPKPTPKPRAKPAQQTSPDLKLKKPKLVRDSFTFPKDEYQAIAGLKQKALGLKHSAKKSEILRAGLMLLNGLTDKAFLAALTKVPALKTGRPAKS